MMEEERTNPPRVVDNSIEIIFNTLTADLGDRTTAKRNYPSHDGDAQAIVVSDDGQMTSTSSSSSSVREDEDDGVSYKEKVEEEKALFHKARQYINPGMFFRFFTYLYAERKLFTFFWIHCVATLIVWRKYC